MATFYNQATLSFNGGAVNSNITTGEILEVLTANKTAVSESYSDRERITYVINLINSGDIALTGLTVTDDLGQYTFGTATVTPLDYVADSVRYFSDGLLMATPTVTTANGLAVSPITVPANGVATIVYEAETNSFAPLTTDGTITNTAVITGGVTPVTVTETISAATEPDLTITKSLSPLVVTENGQITYTFDIQNSGNTAAETTDSLTVTDTFDPALSGITVTLNGTPLTSPAQYTYNEATGEFATVAGVITVPAATFTQDTTTGAYAVTPGTSTLVVSGTV